jgi:TIR domain
METYRKLLIGIVIYVVIETGMAYFLQRYLIVTKTFGPLVHYSLIIVFIPLILGCLIKILNTRKKEAVVFAGAAISTVILYFYYKEAWKTPPNILHALSFFLITVTVAYLGTLFSIPNKPRKIKEDDQLKPLRNNQKKIFISYRRNDSVGIVGRIYDRLVAFFGKEFVYKDVDDIPPGDDFRKNLINSLQDSDVLLVIIGKNWLKIINDNGDRRLNDPHDYVRIEIETAIENDLRIIPILVDINTMPNVSQLPESISDIAYRQAAVVREDPDFNTDIKRLISKLSEI